jgi:FtsZ-binding cell division protein ZapB
VQIENEELYKENENIKKKISELYEKNLTLESDKSSLHIENQQLYKENDKLRKHVYTLEEQLASL